MSDLKNTLVRMGSTNPALRPHIKQVLRHLRASRRVMTIHQFEDQLAAIFARLPGKKTGKDSWEHREYGFGLHVRTSFIPSSAFGEDLDPDGMYMSVSLEARSARSGDIADVRDFAQVAGQMADAVELFNRMFSNVAIKFR